jgi:hypothetical protein
MKYLEAKQLVKKYYKTKQFSTDIETIIINKLLTYSAYYFVVLRDTKDGGSKLTDLRKTCDYFDYEEDYYKEICARHNVEFNNWAIETTFESIKDLENMIAVLDEISNN